MAERLTQLILETIIANRSPNIRVSQEYIEALVGNRNPNVAATQVYAEVLVWGFVAAPPQTGRKYGPALQM